MDSPARLVTGLFHCAIKTNDLAATVVVYTKVLGLREVARPDVGYPGAWLACRAPTIRVACSSSSRSTAASNRARRPT